MMQGQSEELLLKLRALFDAILDEAVKNPGFAQRIDAILVRELERDRFPSAGPKPSKVPEIALSKQMQPGPHTMLHNVTFDPLEFHLEAALMNGREAEARAFLGKLNHAQLEEVVRAQRLPGAKTLQKTILEAADPASAVDAIVDSAAEKVRSRYFAAG